MFKPILAVLAIAISYLNLELPPNARDVLDRNFPRWHLLKIAGMPDSVDMHSHFSNFLRCDLNADSIPDYVLAISTRSDSIVDQHFVALVSFDTSYVLFKLIEFAVSKADAGQIALVLEPKGTKILDFTRADKFDMDEQSDSLMVTFSTDAITFLPLIGCCSSTCVFENGKFKSFVSSD
jgi:hypothetical protein